MSILTVVQDAAVLCGMPRPANVIGSTEDFESEMAVLTRRAGEEIIRRHEWGRLIRTQAYTTNGSSTDFTVPTDFQRLVMNGAVSYGATSFIRGGLSDAEWRLHARQSGATARYRLLGNSIQVVPAVSAANTPITVQYISRNWVIGTDSVPIAAPVSDSDTMAIPERLVTSCLVWMWKRLKKQNYQSELAEYEDDLVQEIASDRNLRVPTTGLRGSMPKIEAQA